MVAIQDDKHTHIEIPMVLAGISTAMEHHVPGELLRLLDEQHNLDSICGLIAYLTGPSILWFEERARMSEKFQCRLVLSVWPACITDRACLLELGRLQKETKGRLQFRLWLVDYASGPPTNSLCLTQSSTDRYALLTGPTAPLLPVGLSFDQANLYFHPDPTLMGRWSRWFDRFWEHSLPLDDITANIPKLVPMPGSAEAVQEWKAYERACQHRAAVTTTPALEGATADSSDTGRPGEVMTSSPTAELGLPQFDALFDYIAHLYQQGSLIAIDESTRLPPLDVPVRAEWFGLESSRRDGTVTREIKFRISAIDDSTFKRIETLRKSAARLLPRFSYSLGHGLHWMPSAAWPFFEAELKAVEGEGHMLLAGLFRGNVEAYVQGRLKQIADDANRQYQSIFPDKRLPEHVINDIAKALTERLEQASKGRLVPLMTRSSVQFQPGRPSEWVSSWGQALSLLTDIARYARQAISDPFFPRGLHMDLNDLLDAMNVCDDHLLKSDARWRSRGAAISQLESVDRIIHGNDEQPSTTPETLKGRCAAVLSLIKGEVPSTS